MLVGQMTPFCRSVAIDVKLDQSYPVLPPQERARERAVGLFAQLDIDGDGCLTER